MQHLLLVRDDDGERTVELHAASSSIGRDPRNSIVLHSREVSRQHAILMRVTPLGKDEHEFRLIDGNLQGKPSTNGLFINGKQRTSHTLHHGDEVVFGAQVEARYFQVEEGTDIEWLISGDSEAIDFMSTMICTPVESSVEEENSLDDSVLARFASFPELFVHPIIEITLSGDVTYINPAAVRQFPKIQTEKINHPVLTGVIEAVKANQKEQSVREIAIDGRIFEQSLSYIRQSDLIRSYLVEITDRKRAENELKALHDHLESEVKKRTLQFHEASSRLKREEKALLASYATNRALLNAIPDPMFRIDRGGNFVNFKTPKHHTLPFDPDICLQRHLSEVFPPAAAVAVVTAIQQALETDDMQIIEFQLPTAEASLDFEARIAISAPDEIVMITRDITERKRGEAEIRTALERERELNEMKTRFVSMTSHEFRTPLTTIMSSAELLEHYRERWDAPKQVQYLHKIQTAARHMTDLLNDVLLINKAEAGKVEFKPQDTLLEEFCREIMEELQITTGAHNLVMRSQIPANPLPIDRKLMRHILTNLLSNAINYSPSGGEILLSLAQSEDRVELQVTDSGIGIPEEARATLFESFVRGGNVGTISGTGLGLAIVKKSVEVHQGSIDCQSQIGQGTTFIVSLPLGLSSDHLPAIPAQAVY